MTFMTKVPATIRLHYFQGRGRGELIRYMLYYAKIPFIDNRIDQMDHWPEIKKKFPTLQVPVLEYFDENCNTKLVCQSNAIVRLCANWCHLEGESLEERTAADEAQECMRELTDAGSKVAFEPDNEKKMEIIQTVQSGTAPRMLGFLEKKLKENGSQFIAGGKSFTYADFSISTVLEHMSSSIVIGNRASRPAVLDQKKLESEYPGIMSIKSRIENEPSIKKYLASRPVTSF